MDTILKDISGVGKYRAKSLPTRTLALDSHLFSWPQLWSFIPSASRPDGLLCECTCALVNMCVSASVSMCDCDYMSVSICMYEQMYKCACVCVRQCECKHRVSVGVGVGMWECEIGCAPLHSALGRLEG